MPPEPPSCCYCHPRLWPHHLQIACDSPVYQRCTGTTLTDLKNVDTSFQQVFCLFLVSHVPGLSENPTYSIDALSQDLFNSVNKLLVYFMHKFRCTSTTKCLAQCFHANIQFQKQHNFQVFSAMLSMVLVLVLFIWRRWSVQEMSTYCYHVGGVLSLDCTLVPTRKMLECDVQVSIWRWNMLIHVYM